MKIPRTMSSWYKNGRHGNSPEEAMMGRFFKYIEHLGIEGRDTWYSFPDLAKKVDCFKCTEGGRTVHEKEQVGVVKIISNQKQQAAHNLPETDL